MSVFDPSLGDFEALNLFSKGEYLITIRMELNKFSLISSNPPIPSDSLQPKFLICKVNGEIRYVYSWVGK